MFLTSLEFLFTSLAMCVISEFYLTIGSSSAKTPMLHHWLYQQQTVFLTFLFDVLSYQEEVRERDGNRMYINTSTYHLSSYLSFLKSWHPQESGRWAKLTSLLLHQHWQFQPYIKLNKNNPSVSRFNGYTLQNTSTPFGFSKS